jgi:hypothetical protein
VKELIRERADKEKSAEKAKENPGEDRFAIELGVAEGLLNAAEGNLLDATRFLTQAAAVEKKQRDADQKEEQLQREMKRLRRLRKQQDVREEERLDKAKKAEAKRTFDPKEYADCHLMTRLACKCSPQRRVPTGTWRPRPIRTSSSPSTLPRTPGARFCVMAAISGGRYAP